VSVGDDGATPRPGPWGWLIRWDEAVAGLALAVVFGAVVWGVFARYVAPQPATWAGEVAAIGFAWVTFIGAAAAARRRLHVGIDLVTARLPQGLRAGLAVAVGLAMAAGLAYAAWLAWTIGMEARSRPTPVLRLPHTIVYLAPTVGLAAMAMGAAIDALRGLRRLLHGAAAG
jgi:TRAP-type C4-dicarboxylate transport system permease small subunit